MLDYYGLTESYPLCANYPFMEVREGSMGRPMPGWDVADPRRGRAAGAAGRARRDLPARALEPALPARLLAQRGGREETFGGDWFHTKDAARIDEDGYVWYEGRADDVIISAGYRIGPFEVESACLEHPAVAEAAAVAVARRAPRQRRQGVRRARRRATRAPTSSAEEIKAHVRDAPLGLRVPAQDRVRRRPAEDADRQDPPDRAAPAGARAANPVASCEAPPARIEASPCARPSTRDGRGGAAQPVSRALLPQWVARLVGLAALGVARRARVAAADRRAAAPARALLWVLAARRRRARACWPRARAGRAGRARRARRRDRARALFAGYAALGRAARPAASPRHWDELVSGLGGGLQALGTVRLPYVERRPVAADRAASCSAPSCSCSPALLTFWPRSARGAGRARAAAPPDRGYPFLALAVLIVVVVSPVDLARRHALAAARARAGRADACASCGSSGCRCGRGSGVAALLAVALAGALPLAAVADRGEPWFDYRSFAESLGPDDPVRFSWTQTYGPITWPRDGNEVMRVTSGRAAVLEGARPRRVQRHRLDSAHDRRRRRAAATEPWDADVPGRLARPPGAGRARSRSRSSGCARPT